MLRTLAINSNQIVLSFGVLIAFWSPKQSKIEESSLESISKSGIQGVWDPAHSTRVGIPSGCLHFPPGCITSGILLPPSFHPNVSHPEFCCRRHSIQMYYIRNSDAEWERRAFQLSRSDISGSSDSAHPESFSAILHSAAVFSWSFPICPTDILRYFSAQCRGVLLKLPDICDRHFEIFCFRYLMTKSPNSPCNPPIIGFLSY